jgi:uncharacterized membrane protein
VRRWIIAGGIFAALALIALFAPRGITQLLLWAVFGGVLLLLLRGLFWFVVGMARGVGERAPFVFGLIGLLALIAWGNVLYPGGIPDLLLAGGLFVIGVLAIHGALAPVRNTTDSINAVPTDHTAVGTPFTASDVNIQSDLDLSIAPLHDGRIRWWALIAALIGFAYTLAINTRAVLPAALVDVNVHLQFAVLLGSVLLLAYGLIGNAGLAVARPYIRWDVPLIAITTLALIVRVIELDTSIRTLVDELHSLDGIFRLWYGTDTIKLLLPVSDLSPFTWLFHYWQAGLVEIFGRTLGAMRLLSALLGTASVVALYGLARALFDRPTALLAALTLAVFPPHIHFSRLGLYQAGDALFGLLCLALLARGMVGGRRADFVFGGICFGLTQYFYEAGRLFFPVLVAAWLGFLLLRVGSQRRLLLRGLLLFGAAALPLFLLYYLPMTAYNLPFAARYADSGLDLRHWQGLLFDLTNGTPIPYQLPHLIDPFLVYVQLPENALYYGGTTALILPALTPVFGVGIAVALHGWRRPGMALLLLWIVGTAVGIGLLRDPIVASRYVVVFPALALALALGLRTLYALLIVPLAQPRTVRLVAVGVLCALMIGQIGYYFGVHLPFYQVQSRQHLDIHDAVLRSLEFPPNTHIIIVDRPTPDGNYANGMLHYFRDDLELVAIPPDELTAQVIWELPRSGALAFYIPPGETQILDTLRTYFTLDDVRISPYRDTPRNRQYLLYYIDPSNDHRR